MSIDGWAIFGIIGACVYMVAVWVIPFFPFTSWRRKDKRDQD